MEGMSRRRSTVLSRGLERLVVSLPPYLELNDGLLVLSKMPQLTAGGKK